MKALFGLGDVVATPAALTAFRRAGQSPLPLLARHVVGDWGELCDADRRANTEALVTGTRLMSVYPIADGVRVWVITEAVGEDRRRTSTCLLLPEDY